MAYYTYKNVRDQLPSYVTDGIEGYQGDPGYDGDQWEATANYIDELEEEIYKQFTNTGVVHNQNLFDWLKGSFERRKVIDSSNGR